MTHTTRGQYKYKGHTISFPKNIERIYKTLPCPIKELSIIIICKKDLRGTNYDFIVNKDWVYQALKYKINNDKFYSNVKVDDQSLDDVKRDRKYNIFNKIKTVHAKFDSKSNDVMFIEPKIEGNDDNRNHMTSMETRTPFTLKEKWNLSKHGLRIQIFFL